MSTHSYIGIQNDEGTIHAIYCHSDGYLDWVGRKLLQHWSDPETLQKLIDLGDLSALGDDLATTQAYGRDFGESNVGCRGFSDLEELRFEAMEYSYVLTPAGWIYSNNGERFRPFPAEFLSKHAPRPVQLELSFPTSEQC
ncbi:MAG: hypothetical protein EBT03_12645 [Betaproteobacteria bacterium]|nr:hypothetical protein [Betaproteobacteria bacterium]NCA17654.1 hypothetical protein [Betaproteobacteria bacterium]